MKGHTNPKPLIHSAITFSASQGSSPSRMDPLRLLVGEYSGELGTVSPAETSSGAWWTSPWEGLRHGDSLPSDPAMPDPRLAIGNSG